MRLKKAASVRLAIAKNRHSVPRAAHAAAARACWLALWLALLLLPSLAQAAGPSPAAEDFDFPRSLDSYDDAHMQGIGERLVHRARAQPFNVVATVIFFFAILHTFLSSKLLAMSHHLREEHEARIAAGRAPRH